MPGKNLTHEEARARAEVVATHNYRIALDLTKSAQQFTSITEIDFSATEGANTFLDLLAHSVEAVELNGTTLDTSAYDGARFPLANLQAENTVRIEATMDYSHTGEGLHRYTDPQDDEVYLYSQFEVADARRVFANFEQPDLKARFTFTVDAPANWQVFSNAPVKNVEEMGDIKRWFFEETMPISTYITAIVAGPYEGVEGEPYVSRDGREIPLGVYTRKSLVQYLDPDEILDITRHGFKFYEDNYDLPYPFRKYDQVFCPEFNAGAMENAGLVTIAERYVFKDRPDAYIIERRTVTILHELAHMWFGDLVTMKWWDDLWLNESFAEYMSYLVTAAIERWSGAWKTFYTAGKVWAFSADTLSSTHPICADIRDLQDVLVNFDGITYSKGGSVLKQLSAWVGQDKFLSAVNTYLRTYQWSNATLDDLLRELEKSSGRDLGLWKELWLKEAGVNTFTPEIRSDEQGRITGVDILQQCDDHASLRPHHIKVALYKRDDDGVLRIYHSQECDIEGERTELAGLAGLPVPDFFSANEDDYAYAKLRFDARSRESVLPELDYRYTSGVDYSQASHCLHDHNLLPAIENPLTSTQIIFTAWDMCRDGELPASYYCALALEALTEEDDGSFLRALIGTIRTAVNLYSALEWREQLRLHMAKHIFALFDKTVPGSDKQLQLAGLAMSLAVTDEQFERLENWLDGKDIPEGYAFDSAQRWLALNALAVAGRISISDIKAEYEKDKTSYGQERAARAQAALPDADMREAVWQEIIGHGVSNARHQSLCLGMSDATAEAVLPYAQRYFDQAEEQWDTHSVAIASNMLTLAFPIQLAGRTDLGVDIVALGDQWLESHRDTAPACVRLVSEAVDTARRACRAQACDAASSSH
ncbi:MAG: aminopeptidase N [Actinomycetaceae bacterium]|nr:aminopeptidase N [Actinomycetaceae bacterium]